MKLERLESGSAPRLGLRRGSIGTEDLIGAVGVARHERCDAARNARVAGERRMLGAREFQPRLQCRQRKRRGAHTGENQ